MTTRNHIEHDIQSSFIAEARKIRGCEWIHAIPNAAKGGVVAQVWMNREGRKSGVSDVFLPVSAQTPGRPWGANGPELTIISHGLYMETKTPEMVVNGKKKKAGVLTEEQAEFILYADSAGYGVSVYRSVQEGLDILLRYLQGEHSNEAALMEARKVLK
jgi:hypothetical protein